MRHLVVRHATTYRYSEPVKFGDHLLMIRPRDSHDLRVVGADLSLSPPGAMRWRHDVFGNSVAIVAFPHEASELSIISTLTLERFGLDRVDLPMEPDAAFYPFIYSSDDRIDLGRLLDPHHPDPDGAIEAWARSFIVERPSLTIDILMRMNKAFREGFEYRVRNEPGTQPPAYTLAHRSGTCRDFALLFIEGVRRLGLAARFVTGYLYDPALDQPEGGDGPSTTGGYGQPVAIDGAAATHAWADVYLPGPGWVEFDPTNGLVAAENLIRVAVTRDPAQAVPVGGTFEGPPEAFLGMDVSVSVTSTGMR